MQVDVTDNFEAYLQLDLHNGMNNDYALPEVYYVRWKEICNTGFGLKVGRDALVFGDEGVGELGSYAAGGGDGLSELDLGMQEQFGFGIPYPAVGLNPAIKFASGGIVPLHNGWDVSGVTQVTPYWEGLDGKLSFELSFMQNVYDDTPLMNTFADVDGLGGIYSRPMSNGGVKYRSRNYGFGTVAARATITPVEDFKITLSFANYRSNGEGEDYFDPTNSDADTSDYFHTKNNTVYGLAFNYRPCFFNRLAVWGQWVHGNNVYFHRGMSSDAFNFGASYDFTEQLTWFVQGDYLRTKYSFMDEDQKGKAWAFYTGLQYSLPYGVSLEAGWKHEQVKFTDRGVRTGKAKANTLYAMCGFEF